MSKTHFVEYQGRGFWAYDVVLAIFLKHLIDVAQARALSTDDQWLVESIHQWRITAAISDCGQIIDASWSPAQRNVFLDLVQCACGNLSQRDKITAAEIVAWPILDDLRIFPRGEAEIETKAITELGNAIVELVEGNLPSSPTGTAWLYGLTGRTTIAMSEH